MDRCRTPIDHICGFACGFVRCVIHCVHMGRHGMVWHAAHLADSVAFSQINNGNGNASFGEEQEGIGGLCALTVVVFLFVFFVVQLFHITAQHSTLCIMYASQPASQPYLGAQLSRRCCMCSYSYTRVLWSAHIPRPLPPLT